MLQPLPGATRAVSFIGAGLAMVAYGASASVGLTDGGEETAPAPSCAGADAEMADKGFADSVGCRLEAYSFKGC